MYRASCIQFLLQPAIHIVYVYRINHIYNHCYMFRYICIILRDLHSCTALTFLMFYFTEMLLKIIKLKYVRMVIVDKM